MPRKPLSEEERLELRLRTKESRRERRQAPYRQAEGNIHQEVQPVQRHPLRQVVLVPEPDLRHRLNERRSSSQRTVKVIEECSHPSALINIPVDSDQPLDLSLPSSSKKVSSFAPSASEEKGSVSQRLGETLIPPAPVVDSSEQVTHVTSEKPDDDEFVLAVPWEENEKI